MSKSSWINSVKVTGILVFLVVAMSWYATTVFLSKPEIKPIVVDTVNGKRVKINTLLTVDVYDSLGNLKSHVEKPDDLLTAQFITFLGTWLKGTNTITALTATLKNDANTDKTIELVDDTTSVTNTWFDSSTGTSKKGGLVGIGTGSTAPARSDYKLQTKVEAYSDVSSAPVWNASSGTITLSGNVAITGSRTITEAILGVRWIDTAGTDQVFIMARDTFAGQAVVNTDVVAVGYVITLTGAEFTSNFGNFLRTVFTTCPDGTAISHTYKDDLNNNLLLATYGIQYTTAISYDTRLETDPHCYMRVGTSSTALSREHYNLQAGIVKDLEYVTQIDTTGITINCSYMAQSSITIEEVALFQNAISADEIIYFRLLTGGDAVDTSNVYFIELRIEC